MRLNAAEWARVESLFPQAAELGGPERARFLDRECAGAPRVRAEIEAMLEAVAGADPLLDAPVGIAAPAVQPSEPLPAGARLGPWKVKGLIGHGGMGEVYLAERADGAYEMRAAIKLLKRELFSYDNAQRFLRERRVLARLSHPNIARVLDAGTTDDGRPYLVMEYVHGARVTDYAHAGALGAREAARLMLAVAEAVAEAHRHGVVHRDLKPANVMVNDAGQVKLLDFGIAKLMEEGEAAMPGAVPMTPAYAAPEQIRAQPLTPAADVYALGVLLFQLVTRRLPHRREGLPLPVIAAGLKDEAPEPPSRTVLDSNGLWGDARVGQARALEGELDAITLRALDPDPARRYATAAELAEELRRFLAQERPPAAAGAPKYWAFISYSHQDEAWAQWLHKSLETWRVPRRLVGRPLGDETVPRRLFPVFRDRDELPSSHELGAVINQALRQSRNLIVVCSPRSATSRWVNEEIKAFRALGRSHRVFCLIVDGEPHASARPEIAFSECFPPALREEGFEPIAADARERKDGKAGARLKLLAGLLDVGLDELKQREKQRQFRQRVLGAVAALALVGVLGGITQWYQARSEARELEIRVEKLVESGRLELLDGRNARAAVYLNEALKLGHDTVPLRYMLARAMEPIDALTPVSFHHGGTVLRAAFSPDGAKVAMAVRIKDEVVGRIYDAANGKELGRFTGLPRFPKVLRFLAGDRQIFVSGFQKADLINDYAEEEPVTGIWSVNEAGPVMFMPGNAGRFGLPVHPDGIRFLASGAAGGLELWDSVARKRAAVFAPGRAVVAGGFSEDGHQVILADETGQVEIWSLAPARRLAVLAGAEGLPVMGVLFFPDGSRAVAITNTGDVRQWDLASSTLMLAFLADPQTIYDAQISRNGRRLLTLGRDGYKVWSTARGLQALTINRPLRPFATASLDLSGNYLFTADGDSPVAEIWGVLSKKLLYSHDLHNEGLSFILPDPQNLRLFTASEDGYAELSGARVRPLWDMELLGTDAFDVDFDPSGTLLVAGGTEDTAHLQRVAKTSAGPRLEAHRARIRAAAIDAQGDRALTASEDGTAVWWDLKESRALRKLGNGAAPMHLAIVAAGGTRAVTADGWLPAAVEHPPECTLWEPESGRKVAVLAHDAAVYHAAFDPGGRRVATGGADGALKLWQASDGALLHELKGHNNVVVSTRFSADGRLLVSASDDKSVRIWDVEAGRLLHTLDKAELGTPTDAVLTEDAATVAIATDDGLIWLWSPADGGLSALKGHSGAVLSLSFLHDSRLLLSRGKDGTVRAWDPQRMTDLGLAAANRFEVYAMDIDAGSTVLATSSQERLVAKWGVGLESRNPARIGALLECRIPWTLRGLELEPRRPDPGRCAK